MTKFARRRGRVTIIGQNVHLAEARWLFLVKICTAPRRGGHSWLICCMASRRGGCFLSKIAWRRGEVAMIGQCLHGAEARWLFIFKSCTAPTQGGHCWWRGGHSWLIWCMASRRGGCFLSKIAWRRGEVAIIGQCLHGAEARWLFIFKSCTAPRRGGHYWSRFAWRRGGVAVSSQKLHGAEAG